MTIQIIDIGTEPDSGDGDYLRVAFQKVNENFSYLSQLSTEGIQGPSGPRGFDGIRGYTGSRGQTGDITPTLQQLGQQVAEDRVQTGEDRIQTGIDASIASDARNAAEIAAVSSLSHAEASLESAVIAGGHASDAEVNKNIIISKLDLAEEYKNQTHQDSIATASDRIQTGLDRIATGEDRIQTGLDRIQTGLDASSSLDSKNSSLQSEQNALLYSQQSFVSESNSLQYSLDAENSKNIAEQESQKAYEYRLQTGNDRIQTNLDKIQTGEDRIQTGLDRTQTGLDRIATGEDRIQTGLDAQATAEDRIQTGLDTQATAEDRIQTGLDRTQTGLDAQATAEDRIQTGLDAQATAEDRIQTGLDRTQTGLDAQATAEDRIQTGLDRTQTGLDAQATAEDRIQTGLDRTQTGLDAQATAEDRIQTGLDRIATGQDKIATAADRVQTGQDRIATAADRVQTGLDRAASEILREGIEEYADLTAADRVQTGLDAEATAADRVQTGLDRIATGEDRVQTSLDVATTLDYKDAAEVAAAAALTHSQTAGEHRVAASGFADAAEQSAIQAQARLENILELGDMTFITVEGAGLITRAGVPFTLTLIKRDSYIDYQVAATGGTVTLDNEIVTYIGTTLGTQTITISAGAATRVITLEVVTNELGSAPEPAPAIGDPLEGGFYAGAVMDTVTTATGSFALSTTAVTLTIPPADLPKFYIGQQIRLGVDPTQGGSSAGLAEGIVIAGTGNQLSLDITNVLFGSGITFSSWIIAAGWKIIVAPRAQGDSAGVAWKTATTAGPVQTQTLTNGVLATSSMADLNIDTTIYPLAKWVTDINIGGGINGFQDWYIPARDELELIWRNLKPITNANYTIGRPTSAITYNRDANISTLGQNGTNDNSLPPGSAYTADIPTQTSITIFRTGGLEAMQNAVYWSSTEFSSSFAWAQYFGTSNPGGQSYNGKNVSYRARAVRRSIL